MQAVAALPLCAGCSIVPVSSRNNPGQVFPSIRTHGKGLHVSFTDIFESELGATLSSCGGRFRQLVFWRHVLVWLWNRCQRGWGKHAPLLDSALHIKWSWWWPVKLNDSCHTHVEWLDHAQKLLWTSNPSSLGQRLLSESDCFCSLHIYWSCHREIMSIMEHSDLKPHCNSGYTLLASFWSLFRTKWVNTFLTMFSNITL